MFTRSWSLAPLARPGRRERLLSGPALAGLRHGSEVPMDSTSPASENTATAAEVLTCEFATDLDSLSVLVTGIMAVPE